MRAKRFVKRFSIAFVMAMTLCLFFAQTFINLTTAKVFMITPTRNYIERAYDVTGTVESGEIIACRLPAAQTYPLTIEKIYAQKGQFVDEGQLLFTGSLGEEYDEQRLELNATLSELRLQKALLEREGVSNQVDPNSKSALAALQRVDNLDALFQLQLQMAHCAEEQNILLPIETSTWPQLFPTGVDQLDELYALWAEAAQKIEQENEALDELYKNVVERDFSYLIQMKRLDRQIGQIQERLLQLARLRAELEHVRMPQSGVLTDFDLQSSDRYDGEGPIFSYAKGNALAIAADVTSIPSHKVQPQTACTVLYNGREYEAMVDSTQRRVAQDGTARTFAILVPAPGADGPGLSWDQVGTPVLVTFEFSSNLYDCVVPLSAVSSSGGKPIVYVISSREGYWGRQYQVRGVPVSILDSNEAYAAISGDGLRGEKIAHKWDREIEDGASVLIVA